jgi:hypothetical protein
MADDDPLAKLRSLRSETAAEAPAPSPAGKEPYEPFKAVTRRQLRLHVRSARNAGKFRVGERLAYSYLHRIVDDAEREEQLALVFQFAVVIIRGRKLAQLAEAIEEERCAWLQPFDPAKWERPDDPAAPFIESVLIHVEREQMIKAHDDFMERVDLARR